MYATVSATNCTTPTNQQEGSSFCMLLWMAPSIFESSMCLLDFSTMREDQQLIMQGTNPFVFGKVSIRFKRVAAFHSRLHVGAAISWTVGVSNVLLLPWLPHHTLTCCHRASAHQNIEQEHTRSRRLSGHRRTIACHRTLSLEHPRARSIGCCRLSLLHEQALARMHALLPGW